MFKTLMGVGTPSYRHSKDLKTAALIIVDIYNTVGDGWIWVKPLLDQAKTLVWTKALTMTVSSGLQHRRGVE